MKQKIIIGERYTALLKNKLNELGLTVLALPENPDISPHLAGHTDLSVFYPGDKNIFLAGYLKNTSFQNTLEEAGLHVSFIEEKQSAEYPGDVQLNARILPGIGNKYNKAVKNVIKTIVFLNTNTVSRTILKYLSNKEIKKCSAIQKNKSEIESNNCGVKQGNYKIVDDLRDITKEALVGKEINTVIYDENNKQSTTNIRHSHDLLNTQKYDDPIILNGEIFVANSECCRFTDDCREIQPDFELIHVNQGYAACTTLDCGDGIISSDNGICQAAKNHGIDYLKISQGHISLPGYSYGFIGGSVFLHDNKMVFTGSLRNHPDRESIIQFLSDRCIEPFFLTDEDIFDIGGAVLITPKC
ncbi:MAG: hypothetical protein Q4F31_02550 [Eubacteriales bacterium]|nr:hypothetical protein [Eubacteriales bacterium]